MITKNKKVSGPAIRHAAAALKTISPAALAWTRLDTMRPTIPTDVIIAAVAGKNMVTKFLCLSTK
jgi:hypothetical protein